jgi:hypothetical protein
MAVALPYVGFLYFRSLRCRGSFVYPGPGKSKHTLMEAAFRELAKVRLTIVDTYPIVPTSFTAPQLRGNAYFNLNIC